MPQSSFAPDRFGYGLKGGEAAPSDGARWLKGQFERYRPNPAAFNQLTPRSDVAAALADFLESTRSMRQGAGQGGEEAPQKDQIQAARKLVARSGRDHYAAQVRARFAAAVESDAPFAERLVHFWANHFAVSADKLAVVGFAGLLEIEAIRPNLLGRFEDLLLAVEQHPAMLLYLDQAQSAGPNSPLGSRVQARGGRQGGLNENLAREILELHTLGVRTGYTQADVTEFARALTGWTVSGVTRGPVARAMGLDRNPGAFVFLPQIHEPGERSIVGKRYAQQGLAQGKAILADLARHPSTARHIATKLARHFAGDDPPPALTARLEKSFLETGGKLKPLYTILAEAPEIHQARQAKFKTPWDWLVSAWRGLGIPTAQLELITPTLNQLGQAVWRPGSPAGFDDIAARWAGPDALFRRAEVAQRLGDRYGRSIDVRGLATQLFPDKLTKSTSEAIARAESSSQASALLLVSPEFLRR